MSKSRAIKISRVKYRTESLATLPDGRHVKPVSRWNKQTKSSYWKIYVQGEPGFGVVHSYDPKHDEAVRIAYPSATITKIKTQYMDVYF